MKKNYLLIVMLLLMLAGCNNSDNDNANIDIVKKTAIPERKNMIIGEIIDGLKDCKSIIWDSTSKDKENIVTATCEISNKALKDEFNTLNEKHQDFLEAIKLNNRSRLDKTYSNFKKILKDDKLDIKIPTLQDALEIAKKHCKLQKNSNNGSCDDSLKDELEKYTSHSFDNIFNSKNLKQIFFDFYRYNEEVELDSFWVKSTPEKINKKTYKFIFLVYGDKKVKFIDTIRIEDDKEPIEGADAFLHQAISNQILD